MEKTSNNIFSKNKALFLLVFVVLLISAYVVPTLARFRSKIRLEDVNVWDGSVAGSYRSGDGTISNPFVISSGQELAYLLEQSKTINYENTYFILNNDIVLNDGLFNYDGNKKYIKEGSTYYLNSDMYYADSLYENLIGTINKFGNIDGFKGTIDGNHHTIYGLFLEDTQEQLALFTNLNGTIKNLYIENAMVSGANITSILAAVTTNSSITNVSVSGIVLNETGELVGKAIDLDDLETEVSNEEKTETIDYVLDDIYGNISETTLKGNLEIQGDATVTINGNAVEMGDFNVSLGSDLQTISVVVNSDTDATIKITGLQYIVDYNKEIASALVGYAKNTDLTNVISKANVYAEGLGSGIIGISNSSTLKNAYNTGNVTSNDVASGIVGYTINDTNIINNTYNTGVITGLKSASILGVANTSDVVIRNVFNTNDLSPVYLNSNSTITVWNSYSASLVLNNSLINGEFVYNSDYTNKNLMTNTLHYSEFISEEDLEANEQNVWLYIDGEIPILYFDSLTNPKVIIHANTYSWTDLGFSLDKAYLNTNVTFMIESYDQLNPMTEIYYYISNRELRNNEIKNITEWIEFTSNVTIQEEGNYVIYVKAVDYEGKSFYSNSDILVVDKTNPEVSINLDTNSWDTNLTTLNYLYIEENNNITILSDDNLSGIKDVKYVLTDSPKTLEELNNLEFVDYSNSVTINRIGNSIIYAVVTDKANNKTIVNTDYLVLNGYDMQEMYEGEYKKTSKDSLSITDKSKVSFVYEYKDNNGILDNYIHKLTSNIKLPENTKMTLIDLKSNEVYQYTVEDLDYGFENNNYASYPLSLFKNIKVSTNEYFDDSNYLTSNIDEKFKLTLDFSSTEIDENITNMEVLLELFDSVKRIVPTLNRTIKRFNVYYDSDATTYLTTSYNGEGIAYNENSTTNFSLSTGISYKTIDNIEIIDTRYENMKLGLEIKLLDSNNNTLDRKYLKNITFNIDGVSYTQDKDGVYRIQISDNKDALVNASITIAEDNIKLEQGTYKINISNVISYDGKNSGITYNEVNIPLIVRDNINNLYHEFSVDEIDSYRVILTTNVYKELSYSIIKKGWMQDPSIRVSLYKKEQLTAYNQDYIKVDLNDYLSTKLEEVSNMTYYAVKNPVEYYSYLNSTNSFSMTILPKALEHTEYKLVFELYNGNDCISTINKYFIVK